MLHYNQMILKHHTDGL